MTNAPALLDACGVLSEMLTAGTTVNAAGRVVRVHSNLSAINADALYRMVLKHRPAVSLEIGMAYAASSLAILTALHRSGGDARLISIDPNQSTDYEGGGVAAVARAGYADRHQLVERPDYFALPAMLGEGLKIDFAFIDGWHTFDYTLLDFWYIDRMLVPGGIVAFDDCSYPAVDKTIAFLTSHRRYEEMDAGLPSASEQYAGVSGVVKRIIGLSALNAVRRATGRHPGIYAPHNRYFRKVEDWEPEWNFFSSF